MWIICKKRKTLNCSFSVIHLKKRKADNILLSLQNKKVKLEVPCLIHEELYICNIYECSGVKKYYSYCDYMPYIV